MMKRILPFLSLILLTASLQNCNSANGFEEKSDADGTDFNSYWYAGEAEITRYAIDQARYGEMRKGDAVLIFVTEDFLTDKQVKYESGDKTNAVSVLKLNSVRKFYTGIYPYSTMTSVFTPVRAENGPTIKVSSSTQEWCGQAYFQLNRKASGFDVQLHSYFQSEADQKFDIDKALLEDEIWTRIRLAPEDLPTGDIEIVPSTLFLRLRHIPLRIEKAKASRSTLHDSELSKAEIMAYTIDYKDLRRKLVIKYETAFPHRILAWEETYPSGFGPNAKSLTTKAVATKSIKSPYWTKNHLSDSHLRDELGLIY